MTAVIANDGITAEDRHRRRTRDNKRLAVGRRTGGSVRHVVEAPSIVVDFAFGWGRIGTAGSFACGLGFAARMRGIPAIRFKAIARSADTHFTTVSVVPKRPARAILPVAQ